MSRNVFADIGLDAPDEELFKARLVSAIDLLIKKNGLTQEAAGALFRIKQPRVSALLNGDWEGFSTDRLIRFIKLLNGSVKLTVYEEPKARGKVLAEAAR